MTCILLFLEIELNLIWLLITWLAGRRWRGVWDFWRLLPVPSDLTRAWDRGAPLLLIPFWDPGLLTVQALSPGEAPGRQPLPPPPGHVSDVEVQEHYDNFFEVRVGGGGLSFP